MPPRSIIVLAALALTLAACGGNATPTSTPGTPGASTQEASATGGAASTVPAGTPGAGETATPGPGGSGATDAAAQAAAESVFHGVTGADCARATPDASGTSCLQSLSTEETIAAGISAWKVSAQGGSSYTGVLGRAADGSWQLWFSSQDIIWQVALPGAMRVCADGQGLNLRASAATTANRIASIADNETVEGDTFVLTEPGTPTRHGHGWYHLQTTPDGWAYSKYLVDAAQPNCDARDRLEA